jgi:hypothetical protein
MVTMLLDQCRWPASRPLTVSLIRGHGLVTWSITTPETVSVHCRRPLVYRHRKVHPSNSRCSIDNFVSPLENLLDPSYPYNGCIVIPLHVVTSNPNANKDDGTCSSVLSSDCLAELKSQLTRAIDSTTGYSGCGDILGNVGTSPTSKCYQAWDPSGYSASRLIPFNTTADEQCNLNPGNSDASNPSFLSWHYDNYSDAPNNFTNYDHAILFPQPVFVVAYTNSSGSTTSSIMCIPANNTTPGSRTVGEADGTSTSSGAMGSTTPKKSSGGMVEGSGVKLAAVIGMIGSLFLID